MRSPVEIRGFIAVAIVATLAAWAVAFIAQWMHFGLPYSWPLPTMTAQFDFTTYFESFRLLHTPAFFTQLKFPFTYMPSGILLYRFFYLPGLGAGFVLYLAIAIAGISVGAACLYRALVRRGMSKRSATLLLAVLIVTSYPIAFCLQRGNLEIVLAIGIGIGAWAYRSGRTWTAAIFWGVCGSVKIYPLLLLAVFLSAWQIPQLLASIASALGVTVAGLLYSGPTLRTAFAGAITSIADFVNMYALRYDHWMLFDHSLFALLKAVLRHHNPALLEMFHVYLLTFAVLGLLVYSVRIRHLSFAQQFLFLTAASIALPPTSFDYTLLQLYAPVAVLLLAVLDGEIERSLPIFVALALLMTPTNFLFLHGVGYTGQIKAVILLILLVLSARKLGTGQSASPENSTKIRTPREYA